MELSLSNISKTYKNGVKALDDVTIDISAGMFGLLGPNGAGKSTLMRTIATLQAPDSGRASFNGINILEDKIALRQTLGYLPQSFGVYPVLCKIERNYRQKRTTGNCTNSSGDHQSVGSSKEKCKGIFRRYETTIRNCSIASEQSEIDHCG